MSLNQLQTPPNRVSRAHEMQREDFLALASAIQRFQAAEAQATLAIVGRNMVMNDPRALRATITAIPDRRSRYRNAGFKWSVSWMMNIPLQVPQNEKPRRALERGAQIHGAFTAAICADGRGRGQCPG